MGETAKAFDRRVREGFFEKYIRDPGIDIGAGGDPLNETFLRWDTWPAWGTGGDAQFMEGVADETYDTVYASHILEHLNDPVEGLRNWFRILRPGGHLIVCVPHRDLYEKKKEKPSLWNPHTRPDGGGHLTFWLPDQDDPPDTLSLRRVIAEAIPQARLLSFRVIDDGYIPNLPPDMHPRGEYTIEAILTKDYR